MKKLLVATALVLSMMVLTAMPAQAASLRVSASVRVQGTGHVVFAAKTTRPSRVKVSIFRGKKLVRSLAARKSGRAYVALWDQRNGSGKVAAAGGYWYRLTAVSSSARRQVSGRVRLRGTWPRTGTATTPPTTTPPATTPTATTPPATTPTATTPATPTTPPATVPTVTPTPPGTTTPAGRWFGLYVDGNMDTIAPLQAEESAAGRQAKVAHLFMSDSESFPAARVNAIVQHGSIPLVTLQFQSIWTGGLDAINDGSHDAYIIAFANAAKANGNTIWLRPFHEMNGNWTAWSPGRGTNTSAKLIAAWRHVHDIFVARGATNVKFVWCPNDYGSTPIADCFPGDAYIDYAAVDTYNFGTTQSGSSWTSFGSKFTTPYNTITSLTSKPLFIAEISCVETGGNKAAWVSDMFQQLRTKYTKVQGIVWFNESKTIDWRMESSQASLNAFKTELAKGF